MEPTGECEFSLDLADVESSPGSALQLKWIAIGVIFVVSAVGVFLPLVGRGARYLSTEGNLFFLLKAFAAGVILSTGFVHILPDGLEAFERPCVPDFWTAFPFGGFVAMMSALTTMLVDNFSTDYYEALHFQHGREGAGGQNENQPLMQGNGKADQHQVFREKSLLRLGSRGMDFATTGKHSVGGKDFATSGKHLVGGKDFATSGKQLVGGKDFATSGKHLVGGYGETSQRGQNEGGAEFQLSHRDKELSQLEKARIRNTVILQVLEVAVISHSFIIGLSLGVSGTARTIRPLIAALSFHQFFEGIALGGSICQVGFENSTAFVRAGLFAVTTPLGIVVGILISSRYDARTAAASVVEGIFDSASAGILIYMALVALIAPDFRSDRLKGNSSLQRYAYLALFSGTVMMSALALWA